MERHGVLFVVEQKAGKLEFSVWPGESEYNPIIGVNRFAGLTSLQAYGYFNWYLRGGLNGDPRSIELGVIEPTFNHPLRESINLVEKSFNAVDRESQKKIFDKLFNIAAEHLWTINITTAPPHPVIVKNGVKNIPHNSFYGANFCPPAPAGIETFFLEESFDSSSDMRSRTSKLSGATSRIFLQQSITTSSCLRY